MLLFLRINADCQRILALLEDAVMRERNTPVSSWSWKLIWSTKIEVYIAKGFW